MEGALSRGRTVLVVTAALALAALVSRTLPVPQDVARGVAAGLHSLTLDGGYSKAQEARFWIVACGIVAAAAWRRWPTAASPSPLPRWAAGVGCVLLIGSLLWATFSGPNPWGTFGFLAEEGVYLGAIEAIEHGRLPWRDLEFPYGPLLLAPAWAVSWVSGGDVLAVRTVGLFYWGLGITAAGWMVHKLRKDDRAAPWLAAGLAAALHPPFFPTLNGTPLRPALALLPAVLVASAASMEGVARRRQLWTAGLMVVVASLFTHELGAPALLGAAAALLTGRPKRRDLLDLAGGLAISGIIAIYTLAGARVLPDLLAVAIRTVGQSALGWQALPYPDVMRVFQDGVGHFGTHAPQTWTEALWAAGPPLVILGGLASGLGRRMTHAGPALAAAVLFRAALGRSDLYHLASLGALPAVVLLFAWIPPRPLLVMALALGAFGMSGTSWQSMAFPQEEERRLAAEAGISDALSPVALHAEDGRAIRVLPRAARDINEVVARVAELPAEDGVLFWPAEATLYALTDRAPPWRLLWAWDAATRDMQWAAIDEIERSRPRWVVLWKESFPIDWIPISTLVPHLDHHIQTRWEPVEEHPGWTLLRRRTR